jgi:hypothetical protein
MDLVDEQHVAVLERVREDGREVAGLLDRRAARHPDRHAELGGDDVRERRLAEPRRSVEEDVVERLAAARAASRYTASFSLSARCPTYSPATSAAARCRPRLAR